MLRAVATRVLLLLVCACALAGCGESGPTDEERIRSTLAAFERATADRDYPALCTRILAPKLVDTVKQIGLPCEVALEKGFEGVSEPRISVGAVDRGRDRHRRGALERRGAGAERGHRRARPGRRRLAHRLPGGRRPHPEPAAGDPKVAAMQGQGGEPPMARGLPAGRLHP